MKQKLAVVALALLSLFPLAASAEWKPSGPITLNIGYKAGGGTDKMARLIGSALTREKGWKFIYRNSAGKGGANLARTLKGASTDGLTIGMAGTDTFSYFPLANTNAGYTADDFDYIIATARSETGLVVRADSGWKSINDVTTAARQKKLNFAILSPRLGAAADLIARKYGVQFNRMRAKGGRGVLEGLMAGDVDIGFVAGIQIDAVTSGDLVTIASAENNRLRMSPNAPTLKELGIPFDFGTRYVVFARKGTDPAAIRAIADAIKNELSDRGSKARQFIDKTFSASSFETGAILARQITDGIKDSNAILKALR